MLRRRFNQRSQSLQGFENTWLRRKEQFNSKFKIKNYNYGQGY